MVLTLGLESEVFKCAETIYIVSWLVVVEVHKYLKLPRSLYEDKRHFLS